MTMNQSIVIPILCLAARGIELKVMAMGLITLLTAASVLLSGVKGASINGSSVLSYSREIQRDPIFSELWNQSSIRQVDWSDDPDALPKFFTILDDFDRGKRGAVELGRIIRCATGCNPMAYNGYGCYCGYLGAGQYVDGIDKCCKEHDWCYERSSCMNLQYHLPYFVGFRWQCNHGHPTCVHSNNRNRCPDELCECDIQFAKCLKQHHCPNEQYRPGCRTPRASLLDGIVQAFKSEGGTKTYQGQPRAPHRSQSRGHGGRKDWRSILG